MERTLTWVITRDQANWKLEDILRSKNCSHHVLTHLKRTEHGICLNGEWAYSSQRAKAGDTLQIHIVEDVSSEQILPVDLPLSIVYEDEDLMVVNKPSDMPIHPSINNYENTLANAVMHYFSQQDIPFIYRCINRLDRDTSGLLIIAKHMFSGAILSQMSAERKIHREYLAITEGLLPESGTIDAPIARVADSVIMRGVDFERGETAITHFRRLAFQPGNSSNHPHRDHLISQEICSDKAPEACVSLASIRLETGRTHQIRVHMKHIGHPLIGDFLYNPDGCELIQRQALHSHRLSFTHPITGKEMEFTCGLPNDMKHIFNL